MPTLTTHLGLVKPSTSDPFVTADIADNWQTLDDSPGIFVCTSTTRPTWGTSQKGRCIIENDTNLIWRWTGTQWARTTPAGLLPLDSGNPAIAEMTGTASTNSTTPVIVNADDGTSGACVLHNVVVPDGYRPIRVEVIWSRADNDANNCTGAIFQSRNANSGPLLGTWSLNGAAGWGGGGTYVALLKDGLAPSTYDFSFQFYATGGGTTQIQSDNNRVTRIAVYEL